MVISKLLGDLDSNQGPEYPKYPALPTAPPPNIKKPQLEFLTGVVVDYLK